MLTSTVFKFTCILQSSKLTGRASYSFLSSLKSKKPATEERKPTTEDTSLVPNDGDADKQSDLSLDPVRGPLPIITNRELNFLPPGRAPRQAWVENLDTVEEKKLGLVDLHPDVFATFPRIEIIQANIKWQQLYKKVNWTWMPRRGECGASTKKPWPQKGLGKARHGSTKSPIWKGGAKAHGPRGPNTYYYMLPWYKRVNGLTSTFSVKLAQDDLKIVDTLDIPTEDPKFIQELVKQRKWGVSVLFVDDSDIAPKNIALATSSIGHMNIMPVYGLNVYSMLKHETLVLTIAAVNKIEEKLIHALNRNNPFPPLAKKIPYGQFQ